MWKARDLVEGSDVALKVAPDEHESEQLAAALETLADPAVRKRYADLGLPTSVPLSMQLYGASPWQGLSGVKTRDVRHPAKREFLSVAAGDAVLAFTPEEIRRRGSARATLGERSISIEWDSDRQFPRAWVLSDSAKQELAVVPMYWFALVRHFETVRLLPPADQLERDLGGANRER